MRRHGHPAAVRWTDNLDDARSTAPPRCSSSCGSAARRRATGDETLAAQVRLRRARRPPAPGGLAKALRTVPVVLDIAERGAPAGPARRVDRRLHQPGRHRDPGAARRRAPGGRPVQRRHRLPAAIAAQLGVDPARVRARPRRPEPPDLDPRGCWSTGSTCCPSCSTDERVAELAAQVNAAGRADAHARRDPVLLPALLLLHRRGRGPRSRRRPRRAEQVPEIERTLLEMYADPRSTTSRSCWTSAAAPTTAKRPRRWSRRCSPAMVPTIT